MATTPRISDAAGETTPRGPLLRRAFFLVGGLLCVAVGSVGVVVPGLPTTIFFILAAAAFTRSSSRLEAWVLGLPGIGAAVRDYRAGLGMPRRAKVAALVMMTTAVAVSVVLLDSLLARGVVGVAGAVGWIVVLRLPTRRG